MINRPTILKTYLNHCPTAVDHYLAGVPIDRSHPVRFAIGTAAHEVLHAIGEGRDVAALCERLIAVGRTGSDKEGPLPADDVFAGRDLAHRWAEREHPVFEVDAEIVTVAPFPEGATFERRFAFDDTWTPTGWDSDECDRRTRIDVVHVAEEGGDEDGPGSMVATVTDYKSSWQDDASALDTLQRRFQAVCAYLAHPEVAGIRMQVANLRRGAIYARTIWLDEEGVALLEQWKADIDTVCRAVNVTPRPARVGAGCYRCRYAHQCTPAREYVASLAGGDRGEVVRSWLAASGMTKALDSKVRSATVDAPIDIDGKTIGMVAAKALHVRPGATVSAMMTFFEGIGLAPSPDIENAIRAWASAAGEPGVTALRKWAKAVWPVVRGKAGADGRAMRADFLAAFTVETTSPRFKVVDADDAQG